MLTFSPPSTYSERPPETRTLVTWETGADGDNPQNWSRQRKLFVTGTAVLMTLNVTFASSAPTSAVKAIKDEFHTSNEISYMPTTVYLLGYVFGPFFWGPGSECLGRRPVFLLTLSLYTICCLCQGIAPNIWFFLVARFIAGFFAVAPLTNCGGVVADIWTVSGRGLATTIFTGAAFLGPSIGPIVSGCVVSSGWLSWRWVFWIMMICAAFTTILTFFCFPETYGPVLLYKKAKRLRKNATSKSFVAAHELEDWSWRGIRIRTIYRPFEMVITEPILVYVTLYISLVYGVLYCLFEAFPLVFITRRHFTLLQSSLMFIGVGIGTTLGTVISWFLERHYPELILQWSGHPPPEERLYGAMIGGPGLAIGAFWLGWTGERPNIPWYVPAASSILLGMSIILIFISFLSYLVDTYQQYSASAYAVNTIFRSAVAASFPLFTVGFFNKVGIDWACTIIGLVLLLLAFSPFIFYRYGSKIRTASKYAPCHDLKIAQRLHEDMCNKSDWSMTVELGRSLSSRF